MLSDSNEVCQENLLMRDVDEKIVQQKLSHRYGNPKKEESPLANLVFCEQSSVMRQAANLHYLKPLQLETFKGPIKLGIEGPGGTGKTLILLLQIIHLVSSTEKSQHNVILMVPSPHNIQCKRFLKRNKVDARLTDTFPLQPLGVSDRPVVRVVDINAFGKYCKDLKFANYTKFDKMVLLREHLFIDDLQSIFRTNPERKETYRYLSKIFDFDDPDTYAWMAFDPVQGDIGLAKQVRKVIQQQFKVPSISIFSKILRNTKPIIDVVMADYSFALSAYNYSHAVPISKDGHTVNGPVVDCYVLTESRDLLIEQQYLKQTLQSIFKEWLDVPTAILYNDLEESYILDLCQPVFEGMGKTRIDIGTFYEQDNTLHLSQIVFDSSRHAFSFEMPLVICIVKEYFHRYNLSTRARSKLILIQLDTDNYYIDEMKKFYPNARFILSESTMYDAVPIH